MLAPSGHRAYSPAHVLDDPFARPCRDMGIQHWYLKVIDPRAPTGKVGALSIESLGWGEVDFPTDIVREYVNLEDRTIHSNTVEGISAFSSAE